MAARGPFCMDGPRAFSPVLRTRDGVKPTWPGPARCPAVPGPSGGVGAEPAPTASRTGL